MKQKQFKKSDYKFRHDLGGICVDYNMDWFTNGDCTFPDAEEEYEIVLDIFHSLKKQLNVGEYFSMNIFGRKIFAYRNEDGVFTK